MYNAEILADSINPQGDRITTMKVTFPRIIHSEIMTHRMFSRNSASSRAIPFKKMVKMVEENPFIPLAFQKNHKGMQGTEYLENTYPLVEGWLKARDTAIQIAQGLANKGVTKQLCNRLLEPFMGHTVIVTATEWENFFELRCPQYAISHLIDGDNRLFKSKKDLLKELDYEPIFPCTNLDWLSISKSQADIHIQAIVELMWDEFNSSTPKQLQVGEYHIPFGDNLEVPKLIDIAHKIITKNKPEYAPNVQEIQKEVTNISLKIAVARTARISYTTLGDDPKIDYEADIRLHDRLAEMKHWSPFEHAARAMSDFEYENYYISKEIPQYKDGGEPHIEKGWCRNFRGWISYRSIID